MKHKSFPQIGILTIILQLPKKKKGNIAIKKLLLERNQRRKKASNGTRKVVREVELTSDNHYRKLQNNCS